MCSAAIKPLIALFIRAELAARIKFCVCRRGNCGETKNNIKCKDALFRTISESSPNVGYLLLIHHSENQAH